MGSIVDKEGELFYADEDEFSVLDVNEQEYCDISGESGVCESAFNGFEFDMALCFISLMFIHKVVLKSPNGEWPFTCTLYMIMWSNLPTIVATVLVAPMS